MLKVAKVSDIPAGTGKTVQVNGKQIALFNCDGKFYAMDNTCAHRGGPLGEGTLTGTTVMCPWHGWEYDVTTGVCQLDPAITLQKFDVKVEGDDVLVSAN